MAGCLLKKDLFLQMLPVVTEIQFAFSNWIIADHAWSQSEICVCVQKHFYEKGWAPLKESKLGPVRCQSHWVPWSSVDHASHRYQSQKNSMSNILGPGAAARQGVGEYFSHIHGWKVRVALERDYLAHSSSPTRLITLSQSGPGNING